VDGIYAGFASQQPAEISYSTITCCAKGKYPQSAIAYRVYKMIYSILPVESVTFGIVVFCLAILYI
jgi:hypothetical protein